MKEFYYGEDAENALDLYLPEGEFTDVFLFFHGGGLSGGDKKEAEVMASYLKKNDVAVVSANYRMYPKAVFPEYIEDAAAAAAWVIRQYGSGRHIFVGGSSAGGYLSMMLCFEPKYLRAAGVDSKQISGYVHDAGQPTTHFNVLRERGLDTRRVLVDEAAPLFYVGLEESYPPMLFIVADDDMPGRLEQTRLLLATLDHYYGEKNKISFTLMEGKHCAYVRETDENGDSVLGKMILDFMR